MLGLGLTAVILSFLAARRISRPLQELTAAAEGLANGAPGSRVRAEGNDEIGRLATAFNRMADSLEAQEQLRKQLVSNAAHELRTPLMIIRGELEGMIDGLLPTTPEALQSLHDEATRLATILDGVDELSRAQAAGLQLQRQEFILLPLLQGIISRFSRSAEEQQVTITLTGDRTVSAWIDPDRFTQIITNLISNALKAMPHGGRLEFIFQQRRRHVILRSAIAGQVSRLSCCPMSLNASPREGMAASAGTGHCQRTGCRPQRHYCRQQLTRQRHLFPHYTTCYYRRIA